jgi:predicted XRE-type DNA-binding protein
VKTPNRKKKATSKSKRTGVAIERGSGNVFADLGVANPDTALAKAELARRIARAIEESHLTQAEAAECLGVDQPKVSNIVRGRVAGFTMDRLFRWLNELGQDVRIEVGPSKSKRSHGEVCVMA